MSPSNKPRTRTTTTTTPSPAHTQVKIKRSSTGRECKKCPRKKKTLARVNYGNFICFSFKKKKQQQNMITQHNDKQSSHEAPQTEGPACWPRLTTAHNPTPTHPTRSTIHPMATFTSEPNKRTTNKPTEQGQVEFFFVETRTP